ncbi:monosaccharide ABC transporter ATP-binding protein (CUT2 family) [Lachnotalea glycerini]|uniref:Monosaccharide ABC transporter ATP-binding protein (CUT2 family) n=1 Tax=Lachnotalea glycerini TaxID=1763509 RepID=A0A255ILG3_9FIRM|nr:sugar ABC transporter ATP-binding protein [Lachnotalea glycerini]PXV89531.1 monosaccharide ABC transporter ATP-binding protein (CUT2 family) [Lachnotalea glycerini]RDY32289.1 sugar ABC transporter ATP-binding protein [Lachnotalea glycerini]
MEQGVVLTMRQIGKTFPGVIALENVDFTLRKGEIHALMGENGAGKSTLIKVLTGVEEFEDGEIKIEGCNEAIINKSPQEAQKNGISTVYQEVNLCPNLSVAENLFIGREPRHLGIIDWKQMNQKSKKLLASLDIHIDVTKALENYSIAIQQMIAIARAVDMSAKVLILDEPTSSLDDSEVEKLFNLMRKLKKDGVGIVFVTHFLEQVYAVCDYITVLRNGKLVGAYEVSQLPRIQLVAKMMGKDFDDLAAIKKMGEKECGGDEVIIEAKNLGHSGTIKPFNIQIHKGEVIGLTGLLGSGRSELARCIYGADKPDNGELFVKGKNLLVKAPIDAMQKGMAYLPENRKEEGIISDLSVRENIIIALQAKKGMFKPISKKEQEEFTDQYIKLLQIKTADRETPIKQLSGGNQQKVILGRWLLTDPDFLILDEPTRGIDIGTKTEIQKLVLELAKKGMAVMFISSEIEEMIRTCSKMAILRDGCKVGELNEDELSQDSIMKAIAGGVKND